MCSSDLTLQIPLKNLRQLYVDTISFPQIELGIQPALTRLTLNCEPSYTPPRWFPNLAGMTSLESLTLGKVNFDTLIAMSSYLPTQLVNLTCEILSAPTKVTERDMVFWTNLTRLSRLSTLELGSKIPIPPFFIEWMKTSCLSQLPSNVEFHRNPSLYQAVPEMSCLQSLKFGCASFRDEDREHAAVVLQTFTQLTQLELDINPDTAPLFVAALTGFDNLVELKLLSGSICCLPPVFYTLHFPNLKRLQLVAFIDEPDIPEFGTWLTYHPELTHLILTIVSRRAYEELIWDTLSHCPELVFLAVKYAKCTTLGTFHVQHLPPKLQWLAWDEDTPAPLLPADHLLTHVQLEELPNNIRRHQTLVDLHPPHLRIHYTLIHRPFDVLDHFWPTKTPELHKEWVIEAMSWLRARWY